MLSHKSKYVAAVTIALFVAVVAYFYTGMKEERVVSPRVPGPVVATIIYTDEGYSPKEVTVKKGEAVRWVNESSVEMWPASAIHPTHALYPERAESDCLGSSFDSCARLPIGSTWEFTFHDVGSWSFHDHIRASKRGYVHVVE